MSKSPIFGGVTIKVPGIYEVKTEHGSIPVLADPAMPKGMFMFGGIPFNYNTDDEDDGDVADIEKLKRQIEDQKKTIDRLSRLQTINPENTIFVLKIPVGDGWGQENQDAFTKLLPKGALLITMPEDYSLEGLTDQDLAEIGLKRATQQISEKQAYDLMLMGYKTK